MLKYTLNFTAVQAIMATLSMGKTDESLPILSRDGNPQKKEINP